MTEYAGYTDTGGVEKFISLEELCDRTEVQGYAADNLEKTQRADDAIWAEEHDDGSLTLDISYSEGGLVDRDGIKLSQLVDDVVSGYKPNLRWVERYGRAPLSLTNGKHLKPAITVRFQFDPDGNVEQYSLFRSRIRAQTKERADFEPALEAAQPGDELWPLKKASRIMRSNPSLTDLAEQSWKPSNRSRMADFSILANVATTSIMHGNDSPWLYRNYHPEYPFDVGDIHDHDLPEIIERLLEEVTYAYYSHIPYGHDALGLSVYGHATGQLASISNGINGILLSHWLDGKDAPVSHSDIAVLASWLNTTKFDGGARKRFPDFFAALDDAVEVEIY